MNGIPRLAQDAIHAEEGRSALRRHPAAVGALVGLTW